MPEPVQWPLEDHTLAKHRVLRSYLDGWIPIMGQQALRAYGSNRRLLLVDGFAGPGRYTGGEPGSPLIMLDALTSHTALPRLCDVKFMYLFVEHNPARVAHLRSEVEQLDLPPNVEVFIEEGDFEATFGNVVDDITSSGKLLVPTFAFIDPFGYSAASMSLTGRFLSFPRSEALFFLPLSYIHRFVGRSGQEAALTALFETDEWREAIPLSGNDRRSFLIELFERQLRNQGQVKHVTSFELRPRDGNDYRLVFATGHDKGLKVMREAMWSVDPLEGTRYVAHTQTGQEVLFQPTVNTGALLSELQSAFRKNWFTVPQASEVALVRTPFLPDRHLKRLTLVPAEAAGLIEVKRPAGRRNGAFTDDVQIRFT
jgi:three-Cys-motif partner protein